jgi:D-glycero-alpha-D-manno-heptose-7-phosphate kinase
VDKTIRCRSPLRISFAGGGSDVTPFPQKFGGAVMSTAIDRYAYVMVKKTNTKKLKIISHDYGLLRSFEKISEIKKDRKTILIRAAFEELGFDPCGVEVTISVDSPPGSGLGSSSALSVSLLGALGEFYGKSFTRYEIAKKAYELERIRAGIKGGYQDQYASAFGGFNFIEFSNIVTVNSLRIPQEIQNELMASIILCNTGTNRLSSNILQEQIGKIQQDDTEILNKIKQLKEYAVKFKTELLKGNIEELGKMLNEQWLLKKQINKKVTNVMIDDLYKSAMKAGAIGGKILGAGGGGHIIFIADPAKKQSVVKSLVKRNVNIVKFNFDIRGLQIWKVQKNQVLY